MNTDNSTKIDYFKNLRNKHDYDLFVASGMFYSCYPELTGNYEKDKEVIDNTPING
jgi:hypothetical protein